MSHAETFSAEDPYAPKKSNRGCLIAGIVAAVIVGGGVAVVACCGGLSWLGFNLAGEQIAADLRDNPVIVERLGDLQDVSLNFMATLEANQGGGGEVQVFDAVGSKGDGQLRLTSIDESVQPPKVLEGVLVKDGEEFDLFPGDAADAEPDAEAMEPEPAAGEPAAGEPAAAAATE